MKLRENAAIITYLDVQEEEGALISKEEITPLTTHVEIHPSLILGMMANMIAFPENNPLPRNYSLADKASKQYLYFTAIIRIELIKCL